MKLASRLVNGFFGLFDSPAFCFALMLYSAFFFGYDWHGGDWVAAVADGAATGLWAYWYHRARQRRERLRRAEDRLDALSLSLATALAQAPRDQR